MDELKEKIENNSEQLKTLLENERSKVKVGVVISVCMLMSALRHDWGNPSGSCMRPSYINL